MITNPFEPWWKSKEQEVSQDTPTEKRYDPIVGAQRLLQPMPSRPPQVSTEQEYSKLEEGTTYTRPDGKLATKGLVQEEPLPDDMYRQDGTVKSASGFLGPIKSDTGRTMTEFTFDLNVKQPDGSVKEMRVPSLVPGLTQSEVELLKQDEALMDLPDEERDIKRKELREQNQKGFESIFTKAEDHAAKRLEEGKSVYYQDDEPTFAITEGVKLDEKPIQEKLIYDDRLTPDDTTKPKAEALSNEEFINDWGKTYQTDNDPVKNKAALKRLNSFDGDIKPEATTAMQVAGAIFDGDKNVTSDQIIDYLTKVGIVESNFSTKKQKGDGPARSYWQVEPATALDLSKNSKAFFGNKFNTAFKKYAKDGETAIVSLSKMSKEEIGQLLLDDDRLAASFAAAKYIATR